MYIERNHLGSRMDGARCAYRTDLLIKGPSAGLSTSEDALISSTDREDDQVGQMKFISSSGQ